MVELEVDEAGKVGGVGRVEGLRGLGEEWGVDRICGQWRSQRRGWQDGLQVPLAAARG